MFIKDNRLCFDPFYHSKPFLSGFTYLFTQGTFSEVAMKYRLFIFLDGRFNELYSFKSYKQAIDKTHQLIRNYKGIHVTGKIVPFS